MLYRNLGKTTKKVSILGFGCMRLPVINGNNGKIDEKKAKHLLRYAIDNGVNYIDTAYPYHEGTSESFVGCALKDGYRQRINLATKLPSWLIKKREDMDKYLNEQLKRLQTDYIDFYLLHNLNKVYWKNLKSLGVIEFLNNALSSGKIKHAGFSFHDDLDTFKNIVDSFNWDFCQIQYNYLDENYQAGTKGLKYAASKGLGIVIMEPLRGGKLAQNLPSELKTLFSKNNCKHSPAEWALKWIWNHPEISVVLSGMNDISQVSENISTASIAKANSLTDKELQTVNNARDFFNDRLKVNCTNCRYCMPCPNGVEIPQCLAFYNNAYLFNDINGTKSSYNGILSRGGKASLCISCGKCELKCPQHIPIRAKLKEVKELFEHDL